MKVNLFPHAVIRNIIGLLALSAVHYISDRYYFHQRTGFNQFSPYLFLLLLYGWIVFHNRILFERLFLKGRKGLYFFWTSLGMAGGSLNMYYILTRGFQVKDTLPHIVSFWVYTLTGFGVYVIYRYVSLLSHEKRPVAPAAIPPAGTPTHFSCIVDGVKQNIALTQILYIESLENYVKVITPNKQYVVRLSLKEAEERLTKPEFIRISRSHIVNGAHIGSADQDTIKIGSQHFKVGKVYKRYVEEQLAALRSGNNSR